MLETLTITTNHKEHLSYDNELIVSVFAHSHYEVVIITAHANGTKTQEQYKH